MSVLARIFLALWGLLLVAACGGLIALSFNESEKLDVNIGNYNFQAAVTTSDGARIAVTIILVAIALIGAISVLIAFIPWRAGRSSGAIRLERAGGGTVEITSDAIEQLLADELRRLPGVRQVDPVVRAAGNTVAPEITVAIDPGANIAEVTSTVSEATGAILREQVGATQVRRPAIRVTYEELTVRHPAARPLAPREGPLPPPPEPAFRRPVQPPPTERDHEEAAEPAAEPGETQSMAVQAPDGETEGQPEAAEPVDEREGAADKQHD